MLRYVPTRDSSDEQLELLELAPGVSSAEVKAESEREQLKLPLKESRKHPGRQELPACHESKRSSPAAQSNVPAATAVKKPG